MKNEQANRGRHALLRKRFGPSLAVLMLASCLLASVLAGPVRGQGGVAERALSVRDTFVIAMVLPREEQDIEAGFRDYLRKRNVPVRIVGIRFSGRPEDVPALIDQVRKVKPDLIYTWGTFTTLALAGAHDRAGLRDSIRDIPIVFTEVADPIGTKLLASLERPGRNVTGVSHVAPLSAQLKAMQAYRPVRKIGYITNPAESSTALVRSALGKLAQSQGFQIIDEVVPMDDAGNPAQGDLLNIMRRIAAQKVDFLYIPPSTFLALTHRDLLTRAALAERVPTFCSTEGIVRRANCLFGLFPSGQNIGRFAALKASQILVEKVPVTEIPAETLQTFTLLINMRIARAIGLYPPLSLLNIAEVLPVGPVAAAQALSR